MWSPGARRGPAGGGVWRAGRLAGGATPIVVLMMIQETTVDGVTTAYWRHTFWIFGVLGLIWCALFFVWFRDHPEEKSGINAAEIALIHSGESHDARSKLRVPWVKLATSPNLRLLCLMYFCASYGWYFNITYLPGFLEEQFGLTRGDKWSGPWWDFSLMAGL